MAPPKFSRDSALISVIPRCTRGRCTSAGPWPVGSPGMRLTKEHCRENARVLIPHARRDRSRRESPFSPPYTLAKSVRGGFVYRVKGYNSVSLSLAVNVPFSLPLCLSIWRRVEQTQTRKRAERNDYVPCAILSQRRPSVRIPWAEHTESRRRRSSPRDG